MGWNIMHEVDTNRNGLLTIDPMRRLTMEDVRIQCSQPPPLGEWHCGANLSGSIAGTVVPASCLGGGGVPAR